MSISSSVDISIVIVNWNTRELLRKCLTSVVVHAPSNAAVEVIVIDNGSQDGSVAMVEQEFPAVRKILNSQNVGFSKANNQGILSSKSTYILLLNSDALLLKNSLDDFLSFMNQHTDVAACGPHLIRPDGSVQPFLFGDDPAPGYLLRRAFNRLLLHQPLHNWNTTQTIEVDWVSGACLFVRRQAVNSVGLLDENIFMYFEDNDWCLRMRKKGWKVFYNPEITVLHVGGQSLIKNHEAQKAYYRSLVYFYRKHYSFFSFFLLRIVLNLYRHIKG